MNADDILHVKGQITQEADIRAGLDKAEGIMQEIGPRVAPNDADRAFNILLQAESGGRHFGDDGKPVTSKAGAIGIAQVMPKTAPEAAKLAGLPWDEERYRNDSEYNRALGRA
ncbi:MAG: hypothetical protein LBF61_02490 [Azoarcus sp.]|jgi:soluble lytic murein transglycosylase|nr:hypothetical protein [Azoarcus sp.]